MHGSIELVERYRITINGVTFNNLKLESEWEGMMKLTHRDGKMIVARGINSEVELLTASPPLLDHIQAGGIDTTKEKMADKLARRNGFLAPDTGVTNS